MSATSRPRNRWPPIANASVPTTTRFRIGDIAGFVLNSNLEKGAKNVPEEAAKMEAWFRAELAKAQASGREAHHRLPAHSFFLKDPDEAEVLQRAAKPAQRYLKLLHDYGVQHVFAGHYHYNAGRDGDLEMVTSGPVGMPLGRQIRAAHRHRDRGRVTHKFYHFGELPEVGL